MQWSVSLLSPVRFLGVLVISASICATLGLLSSTHSRGDIALESAAGFEDDTSTTPAPFPNATCASWHEIFSSRFESIPDTNTITSSYDLDECLAHDDLVRSSRGRAGFQRLLDDQLGRCLGPARSPNPLSATEFKCALRCPKREPELERSVRLLRLGEHSAAEVVELCRKRVAPILVWIGPNNRVKWLSCLGKDDDRRVVPPDPSRIDDAHEVVSPELWRDTLKLLSGLTCLVRLPENFAFGFDSSPYAVPWKQAPYDLWRFMGPLPGAVLRYVGTRAHSHNLLWPTPAFVASSAHCDIRRKRWRLWWRVCSSRDASFAKTTLPFSRRKLDVFWRGPFAGAHLVPSSWWFLQRARLVKVFRDADGFNVGYQPKYEYDPRGFNQSNTDYQMHWHEVEHIPLERQSEFAHLVHVDDETVDWSLAEKLPSGSAVLWVRSAHEYREHYYSLLKPWEHFVPIMFDLSDMSAAKDWVLTEREETERMAQRAQELFRTRLRAQDLYCYIFQLLTSVSEAQAKGPRATSEVLQELLGPAKFARLRDIDD